MTANDLQNESNIEIPEPEHDFDACLYAIKLPMPIPREMGNTIPQFLLLRPDEIALFQCVGNKHWSILVGNPDITKSWFQWKFILFCYCHNLYLQLRSQEMQELGLDPLFKQSKPFILHLIVQMIAEEKLLLFFVLHSAQSCKFRLYD
jgi:hypothetical protein